MSGWQNPSLLQTSPAAQVPLEQAGRQRLSTQWSPDGQSPDVVHMPGFGWQKPLTQWSPAGQDASPVQRLTHSEFTQERPGPHW